MLNSSGQKRRVVPEECKTRASSSSTYLLGKPSISSSAPDSPEGYRLAKDGIGYSASSTTSVITALEILWTVLSCDTSIW